MRYPTTRFLALFLMLTLCYAVATAYADTDPLDCSKKSLADAVKDAKALTITFTGFALGGSTLGGGCTLGSGLVGTIQSTMIGAALNSAERAGA